MIFQSLGLFEVFFLSMIVGSGGIAVVTLLTKFVKETRHHRPTTRSVLTDFNRNQLKGEMAFRKR